MTSSRARWRSIFALAPGIVALVAGCGGASQAPESPTVTTSEGGAPASEGNAAAAAEGQPALAAPSTSLPPAALAPHIEDALAELNRAETAVNQLLAPPSGGDLQPSPGKSPDPLPRPTRPPRDAPKDTDASPVVAAGDRCAVACRALASMQSAARHLCGLAGETDARCESARARVERAESRVRAACASCSEAL